MQVAVRSVACAGGFPIVVTISRWSHAREGNLRRGLGGSGPNARNLHMCREALREGCSGGVEGFTRGRCVASVPMSIAVAVAASSHGKEFGERQATGGERVTAESFHRQDVRGSIQVSSKADRNPLASGLHRIPCKVGVPSGGLHLPVAEESTDHRQAFTQGEGPRREGVAEVVNSYVLEPGLLTNDPPRSRSDWTGELPGPRPEDDPGVVGLPGQTGQNLSRRRRQRDRGCARLGVAQPNLVVFQVDVLPTQCQDFIASASSQHQQPQPYGRSWSRSCPSLRVRRAQCPAARIPAPTGSARSFASGTS